MDDRNKINESDKRLIWVIKGQIVFSAPKNWCHMQLFCLKPVVDALSVATALYLVGFGVGVAQSGLVATSGLVDAAKYNRLSRLNKRAQRRINQIVWPEIVKKKKTPSIELED